jgi:hypothetical protein
MPAKDGFQLTGDDVEILRCVHELRLAHIGHLVALTGRSEKALARRLLKLETLRYLSCITRRPQKHLYTLGTAGVPELVEAGFASPEIVDRRPRQHELKELWLRHFLLVVDVHTQLILATRSGTIRLAQWNEGPALWDQVRFSEEGRDVTIPVRPDAFFALEDTARPEGKKKLYFFLEADRSTMSHARLEGKIKGYLNYFRHGLHAKKYHIKTFGVLTVTETPERAANLKATLQEMIPAAARSSYTFTWLDNLSLQSLLP